MILGFVLGWCAATYWWPWVLSFYDTKPLPSRNVPLQSGIYNGTKHEWVPPLYGNTTAEYPHWKADRGP